MGVLLLSCLMVLGGVTLATKPLVPEQIDQQLAEVSAPIGRIRPAIPAKTWTTVFDATEEGPACPQPFVNFTSEDCLRLNVYSPELPGSRKSNVKKPVLVFFHPGGFYLYSGQSDLYGPVYMMDKDVVLVTVNHRLASLGFLSTGDSEAPGNLGLKDQVLALQWVQTNIAAFGGNPGSVTIFGNSVGAWSVSLHMVSPMSKGLFHRAIAMSGAATAQNRLGGGQIDLARKQAKLINCTTNTTREMMACFRTKPAEVFVDSLVDMFEWNSYPVLLWSPVVEPEIPGVTRFVVAEPEDLITQGKFHQVPLITGITKDEFGGEVVPWVEAAKNGNTSNFDQLNNDWEHFAPIVFQYDRGTRRSREISRELRAFYFNGQPVSVATVDGLANLFADSLIGFSNHRLANLIAQSSSQPVYYYEFTYQGRYSVVVWPETNKPYGVVHRDDLLYLFWTKTQFPIFQVTDPEYVTVQRMTSMWSSFAATGNPIPKNDNNFNDIKWEAFTPKNKKYLDIGNNLTMHTGLYAKRMAEWDKLFPLQALNENRHH